MFKLAAESILMICVPDFAKQGKKLAHFTRGKKKNLKPFLPHRKYSRVRCFARVKSEVNC